MVIALSEDILKILHNAVCSRYPDDTLPGYMLESMVKGCMDYAMTFVYGYEPYPDVIAKASALLYSIVSFHPFMDGNKRTALLATFFFLHFNGYSFTITEDAVQLTRKIAMEKTKKIGPVIRWLSSHTRRSFLDVLLYKLFYSRWKERELTIACIMFLGGISDLLSVFEQYEREKLDSSRIS